jgi:hypothetical protein
MSLEAFMEKGDWKDWRLPENRLEAFRRVAYVRLQEGELDHHHSSKVITDMMNLSADDMALYSLLFGQSYRNHWAMIMLQQFPKLLDTPHTQIVEWHNDNWKRCFFSKDTKWGVRKVPDFIDSIRRACVESGRGPYELLLPQTDIAEANYHRLNHQLREFHGIGRMTAWLAQQTLYELFDWNIDHWDLQLRDDTWSQYDSLCYLFNREDLAYNKKKKTDEQITLMEDNLQKLMRYINDNSDIHMDIYNIESCLCEYRKTAAPRKKPKEFTFWTATELAMQFQELHDAWPEIDWRPYAAGLMTKGRNVTQFLYSEAYFRVIYDHGLNLNTHFYFPDEPDAFEILGLPKTVHPSAKFLQNYWKEKFDPKMQEYLVLHHDPKRYLRRGQIPWV